MRLAVGLVLNLGLEVASGLQTEEHLTNYVRILHFTTQTTFFKVKRQ